MTPHSPAAAILIRHLGLTQRTTAEIQDLYSRPPMAQGGATRIGQS